MPKKTAPKKAVKKKGPGRGWHGNSKQHAEAGRKGGKARAAKYAQRKKESMRGEHTIDSSAVS